MAYTGEFKRDAVTVYGKTLGGTINASPPPNSGGYRNSLRDWLATVGTDTEFRVNGKKGASLIAATDSTHTPAVSLSGTERIRVLARDNAGSGTSGKSCAWPHNIFAEEPSWGTASTSLMTTKRSLLAN